MGYDRDDIERDILTLQSHAIVWTADYHNIHQDTARLSKWALGLDDINAEHAYGFAGQASHPEVMRFVQMVDDVKTTGDRLTAAITDLQLYKEMQNEECNTILDNIQAMVTRR
jgi:hypothetical protein